ncbi:MAG: DNA-binding protein, partial [Prevotella sp.]|nr:DNA-binding protein [Prevotella sp.]
DSAGLEMGIHICDGFALAGGPWITPDESMQQVVFTDTIINGGNVRMRLRQPTTREGYYKEIACYAIKMPEYKPIPAKPKVTFSSTVTRDEKGVYRANDPGWIQYEYPEAVTVRSLEVVPSGTNLQSQRLLVTVSDDGKTFRRVRQLTPPRQGWQNTGFNYTYSIPSTTAKYFRFRWTPAGTEPGAEDLDAAKWKANLKLKQIKLFPYPQINGWEGKSGVVWRKAEITPAGDIADKECYKIKDMRMLKVDGRGNINTKLPEGKWRILRMGHTISGHTNATAGGGKGLECDKFSRAAINKQVDHWFMRFMHREHSHVVKYLHVDSWECGSQNWGKTFAKEFSRRRGYDLMPYLPVMAGVPVESVAKSEAVLRDIRRTINDLINDVFFATVAHRARSIGMKFSSESVAPTMMSDGIEHYKYVDMPMGEYWLNSPTHDKPNDMFDAISGAHVYGKKIVQAEGFTEVRGVWDEHPAMIKPLLDRNFAIGMNRLFFHVNTHNPWMDRKPGMTLDGIGLFFQRDQTWMPESKAFVDYITRCQTLLQKGNPVADIAVFTGDEMPSRSVLPDRIVSMLPGLFGDKRVKSEAARMANVGQPMEESPVGVRHSAGILDLKDWINPLNGYQYDSFNPDVLCNHAKVVNNNIVLPFGAKYRVLVIPEGTFIDKSKKKIDELRNAGVVVIDKPLKASDLSQYGVERDVILPEGIAYTHRTDKEMEIYFIANQKQEAQTFNASFRVDGCSPVVYLPVTDEYQEAETKSTALRTEVSMTLPPNGSAFVLFYKNGVPENIQQRIKGNTAMNGKSQIVEITKWDILFRESGLNATSDKLFDWTHATDDKIKYFSGHAEYTAQFKYSDNVKSRTWLSLGEVNNLAQVWVNGKDCGIAWTAPYRVEVTDALKKGVNDIKIVVVNTWANALRGADNGKAPYDGIWTNAKYRMKGDALLPAGLMGPVEIKK